MNKQHHEHYKDYTDYVIAGIFLGLTILLSWFKYKHYI